MQYLLTSEEYNGLLLAAEKNIKIDKDELQKLCTQVAITMPVIFWERKEATPWGCILHRDDRGFHGMEYCDECPVQQICPNEFKEWSQ